MKKSRITFAILQIVILFYFTSFFYTTDFKTLNTTSSNLLTLQESRFLLYSSNLICTNSQPENILKVVSHYYKALAKNQFNLLARPPQISVSHLPGLISRCVFFTKISIERLEAKDIIFPFDYFW